MHILYVSNLISRNVFIFYGCSKNLYVFQNGTEREPFTIFTSSTDIVVTVIRLYLRFPVLIANAESIIPVPVVQFYWAFR